MDSRPFRSGNQISSCCSLFCKPFSLFVILTGIFLHLAQTVYINDFISYPRSMILKDFIFRNLNRSPMRIELQNQHLTSSPCVLWMAPFFSGGGYSSEAWSYILALNKTAIQNPIRLNIVHHGDALSYEFIYGLPDHLHQLIPKLLQPQCSEPIVVCHSEPGAWRPPLYETNPCPPSGYKEAGKGVMPVIGRTMFETDRLTEEHVARCNRMDYIWVPSEFHVSTFVKSGVAPSKVVKIVQPVDVDFFNPYKSDPLELAGDLVMGESKHENAFVFLSIFKWEFRKGWDLLLKAYLKEFSALDGVVLYLLTNPYHTDSQFSNQIVEYVSKSGLMKPDKSWAPVYVIDTHIAQVDLPKLYKTADAFVLPSRGEGWGRPLVEAMAMELPVIATNWSGPTEFLTEENSYPLMVDKMVEVEEGPFKGHLWAEPSIKNLQELMRHVIVNREEARVKGKRAREDMIRKFSPEIVADIVAKQFQHIASKFG